MIKRTLIAAVTLALSTLSTASFADDSKLQAAIDAKHRTESNVVRDGSRNPLLTLKLFDIQPQHTVMEVWPGGGWYTEILAPYLKDQGKLIAAHYDSEDTQASYRPKARERFEDKMAANEGVYGKVQIGSLVFDEAAGKLVKSAAEEASVDRVVTFRNAHGWVSRGIAEGMFAHFYSVLKPGGKLGVVQHKADAGQDWRSRNIGYVGRDYIIDQAARAGFVLEAEGFFNSNPMDTKRYEKGVWQLPPTLNGAKTDAEKAPYLAIGESDRMTLVFRKP